MVGQLTARDKYWSQKNVPTEAYRGRCWRKIKEISPSNFEFHQANRETSLGDIRNCRFDLFQPKSYIHLITYIMPPRNPQKPEFNTLDWGPVINLNSIFYLRLVRQFYANILDKEADPCNPINSFVKGVKITVSRDTIAMALNIPNYSPIFDMCRDHVLSNNTFSFIDALTKLQDHIQRTNLAKTHLLSKDLPIYECVVATLLGTNVIPWARGESKLHRYSVSFDGEKEEHTNDGHIINEAKLTSMVFLRDDEGNWRRMEEDST
ncbi:hypothetical protein M9H77_22245 [Catharanthus roseus]|uniref:Uncharacterized protein n=1 Tax=Catharanthus roseus TaxID=4058 RepID=A0ACC0APK1_CATRO|nr:hypothetical protein M9H77_22245 [Catharanthus roseus]